MSFCTTNRESKLEMKSFLLLGNASTGRWSSRWMSVSGPSRQSRRYNPSVAVGAIADIGMRWSPEGSVATDAVV
jgi:hypothetical protein